MLTRLLAVALVAVPLAANAVDFSMKLEPGVSIPLTAPQSEVYGIGVGQSAKMLFGITSFLDIGPSGQFMMLPNRSPGLESGVVWGLGLGARLKRPHDAESFYGISPWLDADLLYARTGPLNRPAFDVAVGLSIPLGEARVFWIGPFVRYLHVIQIDRPGYDNHDAKLLTIGLSLEVQSVAKKPVPTPEPEVHYVTKEEIRTVTVTKEIFTCPDGDKDGVVDNADLCPDVAGPVTNSGCPVYQKLVVKKEKLELKEKLFFDWDKATLMSASYAVLDEVAQALKDNKSFSVQVEGHTDDTGTDDHNQSLSEQRAETVLNYLVGKGIAKERLNSKGFASAVPLATNKTSRGREKNRRVEFVVHFTILNPGSTK